MSNMDGLHVVFYWTCPHCGLQQPANILIDSIGIVARKVVVCGSGLQAGCLELSAVSIVLTEEVTVYKMVEVTP